MNLLVICSEIPTQQPLETQPFEEWPSWEVAMFPMYKWPGKNTNQNENFQNSSFWTKTLNCATCSLRYSTPVTTKHVEVCGGLRMVKPIEIEQSDNSQSRTTSVILANMNGGIWASLTKPNTHIVSQNRQLRLSSIHFRTIHACICTSSII